MGKSCPYDVISYVAAPRIFYRATHASSSSSIAYQLMNKRNTAGMKVGKWSRRKPWFRKLFTDKSLPSMVDVHGAGQVILIFEALDFLVVKESSSTQASDKFEYNSS